MKALLLALLLAGCADDGLTDAEVWKRICDGPSDVIADNDPGLPLIEDRDPGNPKGLKVALAKQRIDGCD